MKETNKLEDIEDDFPYLDILNLKYHQSLKYPHLSKFSRAGQFSPFAALTGYEEEVKEAERFVLPHIDLSEEKKEDLDRIISNVSKNDLVKVKYFVKDKNKNGGKYITSNKTIKKIDNLNRNLIFTDESRIPLNCIVNLEKINIQDNDNLL